MSNCCNKNVNTYPDHSKELPRLNRISGQIEGIKKMIEEQRYCPDIMIQLNAARSAIKTIEADILERHLHGCVSAAIESGDEKQKQEKINEIKNLFKKYND